MKYASAALAAGVALLVPQARGAQTWVELSRLNGLGREDDLFGRSVAFSSRGQVLAVGAPVEYDPFSSSNNNNYVTVLNLDTGKSWLIAGPGPNYETAFGSSVSLSEDGTRVAVGAPEDLDAAGGISGGRVRIYELGASNSWSQVGQDIVGVSGFFDRDELGYSVSLSADGKRVAVGLPGTAKARVYEENDAQWTQLGGDIVAETFFDDYMGGSISLSPDGDMVAVSIPGFGTNGINNRASVFQLTSDPTGRASAPSWSQLGGELEMVQTEGNFDDLSVSLATGTGIPRVAIGAIDAGSYPQDNHGKVSVYEYDTSAPRSWRLVGANFTGSVPTAKLGSSVSLSRDGRYLAIGASGSNEVSVWEENTGSNWTPLGSALVDPGLLGFGSAVAFSGDGQRLAIGAPDANGESGAVLVYGLDTPTDSPTSAPTGSPSTSVSPTASPTASPTGGPTPSPTDSPTSAPTGSPTTSVSPTASPTAPPTGGPTPSPTASPTPPPTGNPTASLLPTAAPTSTCKGKSGKGKSGKSKSGKSGSGKSKSGKSKSGSSKCGTSKSGKSRSGTSKSMSFAHISMSFDMSDMLMSVANGPAFEQEMI